MPYFLLLPWFFFWVGLGFVATIACLVVPTWRGLFAFVWRSVVGSTLGFVLGNALAVLPAVALHAPLEKIEDPSQLTQAYDWCLMIWAAFVGPVAGSGLGLSVGLYVGFRRARTVVGRRARGSGSQGQAGSTPQST